MTNTGIDENSPAVQSHLTILQSAIQRMASNSSSSKAWCITLVAAILVIVSDKESEFALIAVIPTVLFFFLDSYYLCLEKGFRESYKSFIKKLNAKELEAKDLFEVEPSGNQFILMLRAMISFSVWPLYFTLVGMIYIARCYIF